MRGPINKAYRRRFVCYFYPVGWSLLSLGVSLDLTSPNLEIHLPFGFVRLGWVCTRKYYYAPRAYGWDGESRPARRVAALLALFLLFTAQIFGPRIVYEAKLTGHGFICERGEAGAFVPLAPVATLRVYEEKAVLTLTVKHAKNTTPFAPGTVFVGTMRGAVRDKPGEVFEVEVRVTRVRGK